MVVPYVTVPSVFIFQTAVSHVMRIRLGGKSYRPDPNQPLGNHVKGLGELVDLLHKLQTVMEEEMNTRSVSSNYLVCKQPVQPVSSQPLDCEHPGSKLWTARL